MHAEGLEAVPCSRNELVTMPIKLKTFAYTTTIWREWEGKRKNLFNVYTRELRFLSALIPLMNKTATSLTLPMESCPILQMAAVQWPQLKELILTGRFIVVAQPASLHLLLRSMPALRVLSVQAARSRRIGRRPLFTPAFNSTSSSNGASRRVVPRGSSPAPLLPELRSLTIAFPDPQDDVFSIDARHLTHLSLRDFPRYYHYFAQQIRVVERDWVFPILSPAECLSILKRLVMPSLDSLELVYEAPEAGSDDELLTHVAEAYPRLSHLEIHRYRKDRAERVQHVGIAISPVQAPSTHSSQQVHIASKLVAARSLRTIHLNLDFHDDHGPYYTDDGLYDPYYATLTQERGPALLTVLESCPLLEFVGVLYHDRDRTVWLQFHPSRCAEPHFVHPKSAKFRWVVGL